MMGIATVFGALDRLRLDSYRTDRSPFLLSASKVNRATKAQLLQCDRIPLVSTSEGRSSTKAGDSADDRLPSEGREYNPIAKHINNYVIL